ncbi:hypothetical protein LDL79_02245 [Leeuwenhoekiella palythoae]|uniref:hypothetical protein n=1 Tax=Leeuwenhoekiella palythoae TaxID=573501 RepID=UPI001CE1B13A|nr:hypothetical protein [Leeuwenhoekiella palythoae]UBZ10948.1 hypothetical protein LDL79_02245 [Leeuwenhoekiella palythoae]
MKSLKELKQELERLEDLYEDGGEDYDAAMQFEDDLEEASDDSNQWKKLNKSYQNFLKDNDFDDGYDEGDMLNMMFPNGRDL